MKNKEIPTNLQEAILEVKQILLEENELENFLALSKEDLILYHHSFGRWMRNNWGLWSQNSQLYCWFQNIGIWHPDDMSGIIINSSYKYFKNIPINLDDQIKYYQDYWEALKITNMEI